MSLNNDLGFLTVNRRIYCRKFLALSNQMSCYIRRCIRILKLFRVIPSISKKLTIEKLIVSQEVYRDIYFRDDPSSLGPFLVISDELDRLTNTNKIGIYEVVWRFKSVFPNMIPDFVSIVKKTHFK